MSNTECSMQWSWWIILCLNSIPWWFLLHHLLLVCFPIKFKFVTIHQLAKEKKKSNQWKKDRRCLISVFPPPRVLFFKYSVCIKNLTDTHSWWHIVISNLCLTLWSTVCRVRQHFLKNLSCWNIPQEPRMNFFVLVFYRKLYYCFRHWSVF